MRILHVVPCADEANGVYHVARMLAKKQNADGHEALLVTAQEFVSTPYSLLPTPDEVWIHGMWLPSEWRACWKVLREREKEKGKRKKCGIGNLSRPRLVRMTHGSLSPVYLERQGKWKKRLVAPIERWLFSKTDRVVTTGPWETEWCRKWGLRNEFQIVDLKSFFNLSSGDKLELAKGGPLHVLYLGMRHPLKGVQYLEQAVGEINEEKSKFKVQERMEQIPFSNSSLQLISLRIESSLFGDAKESAWDWCDVLCLPTLSENFGLVVAEAFERGKRVIVTDGAPAWEPPTLSAEVKLKGQGRQWWDHVSYLRGYRDGSDAARVKMLKDALLREMV